MTEEMIQRINELARKKKERGLTLEELTEQKRLYAIYLADIRQQMRAQLGDAPRPTNHDKGDGCADHHQNGKCRH